ncbi:F-box protein, partial [Trifolium pratense]
MKQLIDFLQLPVIHLGHLFYIYGPRLHYRKIVTTMCEVGQPVAVMTYNFDVPYIFQWRPCVADKHGHTFMIGDNSNVCLLANPEFGGNVKFLVESECELLLVDCYGIDIGAADKDIRFDVFMLDEKEKNWVKLTTLGDRVLFVNQNCSFSASASDLHVANGSCIIYTSRSDFQNVDTIESRMRIFHLDNGRVSRLSRYPDYIKLFWPPPKWILELHNK